MSIDLDPDLNDSQVISYCRIGKTSLVDISQSRRAEELNTVAITFTGACGAPKTISEFGVAVTVFEVMPLLGSRALINNQPHLLIY